MGKTGAKGAAQPPKGPAPKPKSSKPKPKGKNPSATSNGAGAKAQQAPVASSAVTRGSEPRINHRGDHTVVCHSEYVCDVLAPTPVAGQLASEFVLISLAAGENADRTSGFVNPGNPSLFRWLSAFATRFEGYRFKTLKFRYEPRCSTGTAGEVLLAMDMDCDDNSPNSKAQMYDWRHRVGGAAWQRLEFSVPTKDQEILSRKLFVSETYSNANANSTNFDPRTAHMGTFYMALNALTTAGLLGDLFVDYEVEFFVVQLNETNSVVGSVTKWAAPTAPTAARPYGTGTPSFVSDGARFAKPVTDASYNLWEIVKPGVYQVMSQFLGTGLGAAGLQMGGSTASSMSYTDADIDQASTTDKISVWTVNVTQAPMVLRVYLAALTTCTAASLWLSKLPFLSMPGSTLQGSAYTPSAPTVRISTSSWDTPKVEDKHEYNAKCQCLRCFRIRGIVQRLETTTASAQSGLRAP